MPQYYRKTDEVKRMGVFTTNWYLYKTHLHPNYKNSQTQNPSRATRIHGSNEWGAYNPESIDAEKTQNFENVLMEAIDEGLDVLGESSKQALYFNLEKTFKINTRDIPYKIEEFTDAVEKIFGKGSRIIEIQIMKCLFKKVRYNVKLYPKQKNLTFTEYVTAVKIGKENLRKNSQNYTATRTKKDAAA